MNYYNFQQQDFPFLGIEIPIHLLDIDIMIRCDEDIQTCFKRNFLELAMGGGTIRIPGVYVQIGDKFFHFGFLIDGLGICWL